MDDKTRNSLLAALLLPASSRNLLSEVLMKRLPPANSLSGSPPPLGLVPPTPPRTAFGELMLGAFPPPLSALPPAPSRTAFGALMLGASPQLPNAFDALSLLGSSPPPPTAFGALSLLGATTPTPFGGAPSPLFETLATPVKRKAFFSFHFDDVMRASVVRKAWKFTHPDSPVSFYDGSLWERRKIEGFEALKRLIREGVDGNSAVCVLVGAKSWERPCVRYEIARAIIDGRGLLAVHLNSIKPWQPQGLNPLAFMAVGKVQPNSLSPARYYLFEQKDIGWVRYEHHTHPVKLPPWLRDPRHGYVTPLAEGAAEYDYMCQDGHKNIGLWIDRAAQQVDR